jgi:uncharacterized protein YbjT (DUF2867 family)
VDLNFPLEPRCAIGLLRRAQLAGDSLVKVLLFGATGMDGGGALVECLADSRIDSVVSISRSPAGRSHPKLREVIQPKAFSYNGITGDLSSTNACFFCLGVTSVGMTETAYTSVTYDLTLAAARAIVAVNRSLTFCYVSGMGTDSSEQGRSMWARVKGRTENSLLALPFKAAYMFRPGYIQPVKGVRSKTGWYQAFYTVAAPLSPLLQRFFPGVSTTTAILGRALIQAAAVGYSKRILEPRDINELGTGS